MAESKLTYQTKLTALTAKFVQSLKEQCQYLADQVTEIEHGNFFNAAEIQNVAHRLAGSCGSFGYQQLGELAKQLEHAAMVVNDQSETQGFQVEQLVILLSDFLSACRVIATEDPIEDSVGEVEPEVEKQEIWLVSSVSSLYSDLTDSLHNFGWCVRTFSDLVSCLNELNEQKPLMLWLELEEGKVNEWSPSLKTLLKTLKAQNIIWVAYSKEGALDRRVEAVSFNASAFFESPINTPMVMNRLSHLVEQHRNQGGRVCILDDDTVLAERYALYLEGAGIDVFVVKGPHTLIQDVLAFQPELMLMDLHMPIYNGYQLAGVIRQYESLRSLPLVYLSAESDIGAQLNAMSYGADDFLLKPISADSLVKAVMSRLTRSRDLKALMELDGLTGLLKHTAIKELAGLELERAKRSGLPFSVAMIDLDYFKQVNDTCGHPTGDLVISTLATLLQQRIRKTDKAGRYGGEEFLVLLPGCTKSQAESVVNTVLASFSAIEFRCKGSTFQCTFSAGIATLQTSTAEISELLLTVDENLYEAKSLGRNRVVAR